VSNLFRLIYTSFMSAEADPLCAREIVRESRNKNRQQGITGLLIFDGLRFCQYFEGPQDAVYSLSERIRQDTRHIEFAIKEHGPLPGDRRFTWAMGYALCEEPHGLDELHRFTRGNGSAFASLKRLLPSLKVETG
jgi:hypothetical protein